jgi:hypothetical protein
MYTPCALNLIPCRSYEPTKFLFRLDWPLFRPEAALTPETFYVTAGSNKKTYNFVPEKRQVGTDPAFFLLQI